MTSQETEPKLPASVEGPPVEAWVGRGSPQGQAHCKVLLGLNPLGVCHQPCHRAGIPQGSVTSGQTTTREGVQDVPTFTQRTPSRQREPESTDEPDSNRNQGERRFWKTMKLAF